MLYNSHFKTSHFWKPLMHKTLPVPEALVPNAHLHSKTSKIPLFHAAGLWFSPKLFELLLFWRVDLPLVPVVCKTFSVRFSTLPTQKTLISTSHRTRHISLPLVKCFTHSSPTLTLVGWNWNGMKKERRCSFFRWWAVAIRSSQSRHSCFSILPAQDELCPPGSLWVGDRTQGAGRVSLSRGLAIPSSSPWATHWPWPLPFRSGPHERGRAAPVPQLPPAWPRAQSGAAPSAANPRTSSPTWAPACTSSAAAASCAGPARTRRARCAGRPCTPSSTRRRPTRASWR